MPNQASGPCTHRPPIRPWAAFPLPFHFSKSSFPHQTFPHSPQRLIFCTINNQGPSLSDPNPASAITFCVSQASGYGTPAFPHLPPMFKSLPLCPYHPSALLSLLFRPGTLLLQDPAHLIPLLWNCSHPSGTVSLFCPLLPKCLPSPSLEPSTADCEYLGPAASFLPHWELPVDKGRVFSAPSFLSFPSLPLSLSSLPPSLPSFSPVSNDTWHLIGLRIC